MYSVRCEGSSTTCEMGILSIQLRIKWISNHAQYVDTLCHPAKFLSCDYEDILNEIQGLNCSTTN